MGSYQLTGRKCDRCGHKWVPRLNIKEKPAMCPSCKSPYWDKTRRIDIAKQKGGKQ